MRWHYKSLLRLRSLFRKNKTELDLSDELQFHIQNQIDEAPLTLPIEYLSAAREWLISMVMMKEQFSNEVTIPPFLENDFNTSELPIQPSTSVFNFTLPANETESDLQ